VVQPAWSWIRKNSEGKDLRYIACIMYKVSRGNPLTLFHRSVNRLIGSVCYLVEQCIGTLKRGYHFLRMRYKGLRKEQMELYLNTMTYNLKKAVLKMA